MAYNAAMTRALAILTLVLIAAPVTTDARCIFKFCQDRAEAPTLSYIVNQHRQKVGDIYNPGHGRRLQVRNSSRQILGYIEADGTITNRHRQPVGKIELD